ncbi:MAG TPA: hypothetical protein VIN38_07185 [Thiobacillus sp.]
MKSSRFFAERIKSYIAEVDDLITDSDGKMVLQKRLNDKRREIDAILPMIEFSPEMVSVVFYGAFDFLSVEAMQRIVLSEPEDDHFPNWKELATDLTIADWAHPLIESTLKVQGGDPFLVATATLEFLRGKGPFHEPNPEPEADQESRPHHEDDDGDEYGSDDLNESGADWLEEQGFDPLDRPT